jgi:hypothetical protein
MQWTALRWSWARSLSCLLVLGLGLAPQTSRAQDPTKNLEYFAECVGGPCDIYAGGGYGPWEYVTGKFPTAAGAEGQAIADYLYKDGWDEPQVNSPWRTRCGPAEVSKVAITYKPFPAKWMGSITFAHTCQSYRPDGLSPPGTPTERKRSISTRAVCRPGYTVKNYNTGECWRQPNDCPRYPENSTFGCGESVAELEATAKTPPDPTALFHAQQTCIARKSCELRCQMDNCQWMDKVIPEFVRPYIDGNGLWPQVEASCTSAVNSLSGLPFGKWIADRECFSSMGWYHVRVDLNNALTKHGCGSQRDWDLVGEQITPCLKETQPGYRQPYYELGGIFVHAARGAIRQVCRTRRTIAGLPLDVDSDISGKVCKVSP